MCVSERPLAPESPGKASIKLGSTDYMRKTETRKEFRDISIQNGNVFQRAHVSDLLET